MESHCFSYVATERFRQMTNQDMLLQKMYLEDLQICPNHMQHEGLRPSSNFYSKTNSPGTRENCSKRRHVREASLSSDMAQEKVAPWPFQLGPFLTFVKFGNPFSHLSQYRELIRNLYTDYLLATVCLLFILLW